MLYLMGLILFSCAAVNSLAITYACRLLNTDTGLQATPPDKKNPSSNISIKLPS